MKSWEYILETDRKNIDFINKVFEAYEGIANVRTLDNQKGIIKIITNSYFLDEVDRVFEKLKNYNINTTLIEKNEWKGIF